MKDDQNLKIILHKYSWHNWPPMTVHVLTSPKLFFCTRPICSGKKRRHTDGAEHDI